MVRGFIMVPILVITCVRNDIKTRFTDTLVAILKKPMTMYCTAVSVTYMNFSVDEKNTATRFAVTLDSG